MCLHGPDTMKSGLVFRGQKETKLLRFELFSGLAWILDETFRVVESRSITGAFPSIAMSGALC
jgi:hypothetical protein